MGGIVAQGTDKIQTLEDFPADDFLKSFRIEERDQLFLIRHRQRRIDRIHPFDRQLHRFAAVDRARGGINGKDPLCGDSGVGKAGKLFLLFQEIEIGHAGTSSEIGLHQGLVVKFEFFETLLKG